MRYSKALQMAWQIAAWEATSLLFPLIEKEFIVIGILSLEKVTVSNYQKLGIDQFTLTQIEREFKVLLELLIDNELSVTKMRRSLRSIMGEGNHKWEGEIIHRSEECKRYFQEAEALTLQVQDGEVSIFHYMAAMFAKPGERFSRLLNDYKVDSDALKALLIKQAGKIITVPADNPQVEIQKAKSFLDRFGRDLTKDAREGKFLPFVGRQKELDQVIITLARSAKNNPILIGDPGVGKTAIVEALASRIALGTAPEFLRDKRLIELNMGVLVAGTLYRGEFEERLTRIVEEVKEDSSIILFIDEFHTLVGAGRAGGSLDASNILKPALSRGEFKCIGATTLDEYRRYIEKDAALERRFEVIAIEEPSRSDCVDMMRGLREKLESFHSVKISDAALEAAVDLSIRFDADHRLPDKAIDLIDRASARIRAVKTSGSDMQSTQPSITEISVLEVMADASGIPLEVLSGHLIGNFREHLVRSYESLRRCVIGQSDAIDKVVQRLTMSYAGITRRNGPLAIFLFLGPSGVGKTELAKQLAIELFGTDKSLIRLDMSEYKEEHSVSKLIGSPPGYVGYEEEGQLTGRLRKRPYSLILLDEVEKAHPRIFDLFLQLFDEGRLTDAKGRLVDASNCIVVMTTNIRFSKSQKLGFGVQDVTERNREIPELKEFFRPELLNRIDEKIIFHYLDKDSLMDICETRLAQLKVRMFSKYRISLNIEFEVKSFIANLESYSDKGVRGLQRNIEHYVEIPLSNSLLQSAGQTALTIQIVDNEVVIRNHAS